MTGLDKAHSKLQKKINRLTSRIHSLQKFLRERKNYARATSAFIEKLVADGKITKTELKEFFKKRHENS